MNKGKKFTWVLVILSILFGIYIFSPGYLKKSVIYLFPGIDDYQIFENREVGNNNGNPWSVSNDYMKLGLNQEERDTLEAYKSVAYLIFQNDSIIYEEYWDGYDETSLSNSFSIAKSIVSLLIGAAIDDGYINSVEQHVGDFIAEFNSPPNDQLKIKDLLTMSSGLNWEESYSSPFSLTTQAYYGNNVNQLVKQLEVVETPGKRIQLQKWRYPIIICNYKKCYGQNYLRICLRKAMETLGSQTARPLEFR